MDVSLIFVIVIMFYFCDIFPLQMRRYIHIRQQRQQLQRSQTTTRNLTYQNTNSSSEQSDNHLVFGLTHPSGSQSDDSIAAARHLEAEHRQQIIEIQREIEQQAIRRRDEFDLNAPHLPPRIINSSTVRDPVAEYSQQIIDMQREIEQQAIRRHEERLSNNTLHMPPRLINSSTIRSSIYTITSGSAIGVSNSSVNYPYAPPQTPDGEVRHTHFLGRPNSKDYRIYDAEARSLHYIIQLRKCFIQLLASGNGNASLSNRLSSSSVYTIKNDSAVRSFRNDQESVNNSSIKKNDDLPTYDEVIASDKLHPINNLSTSTETCSTSNERSSSNATASNTTMLVWSKKT